MFVKTIRFSYKNENFFAGTKMALLRPSAMWQNNRHCWKKLINWT